VNSAARLESANKHLGTRVCISAEAVAHCPEEAFRPIARLILRGKTEPLGCFTAWDETSREYGQEYLRAYEALERGDPASFELFAALHRRGSDDGLIAFHWRRLQRGETGTTVVLEEK
jgi:adenylate cyclase